MITWMSGFTKVAPCTWANGKISDKSYIQPGLLLLCKQRENIERFCVNRVSSQIFQPVKIKHVNEASVWHIPHACNVFYTLLFRTCRKKSSGLGHWITMWTLLDLNSFFSQQLELFQVVSCFTPRPVGAFQKKIFF